MNSGETCRSRSDYGGGGDDDDDEDDGGEVREICGGDHKGGLLLFLRSAVLSGARMGWRRGCREISMDPQPVETNQGPLKLLVGAGRCTSCCRCLVKTARPLNAFNEGCFWGGWGGLKGY